MKKKKSAKAKAARALPSKALNAKQAAGVKGGKPLPKLMEAALKGKVFKKVEIHGIA